MTGAGGCSQVTGAGCSQEHKLSVSEGCSCPSAVHIVRLRLTDSRTSAPTDCRGDVERSQPADGVPTAQSRLSADRKDVGGCLFTSGDVIAVDRKRGVAKVEAGCTSSGNDVSPASMSPVLATYTGVRSGRHIASFPLPVLDRK